ncbi:MAG: hypothetical protein FWE44_01795 [Defluviitaleaceae bacterium]|nr:hypothetical protein [Defluviitaleaceae bacterium]
MKNFKKNGKLLSFILVAMLGGVIFALTACGGNNSEPVDARATYEINRLYMDGQQVDILENYAGSRLTFVGEENGGNVIIRIGTVDVQASINPSREHPSFADGFWHHHLYAGVTASGSPRINLAEALPALGIDDNQATDNTQSNYQRGNLHYIVETGEFRLRLTIDGIVHDLIFAEI